MKTNEEIIAESSKEKKENVVQVDVLKSIILAEMVHSDAEIEKLKIKNNNLIEKERIRFRELKSSFLKELRKTAYPRLKRTYGGVLYVQYLTSSPEFNEALRNLINRVQKRRLK